MKLIKEAEFLTRGYGRTGGKDNRRQQRARMLAFAEHCAATGAHSFGQVGKNHVISYWKAHRTLSPATAYIRPGGQKPRHQLLEGPPGTLTSNRILALARHPRTMAAGGETRRAA